MKKLYALIIIVTVMLNLFQHLHAQKWEKTQPDILYAQDKDKGLNVKIGIGTDQPTAMLDVFKRTHLRGNVAADSSLSAFSIIAQQAQFATAVVTGQITAGSLTVSGNATINGQLSSSSLSVTGNSTLNNATINQQLTTSNITSSTGSIDFSNNNLTTTGNVNSTNISAIQTSVGSQQSQIANLNTQVSAIHSSQWTTNPIDSSISFNGNVFVKNLGVSDVISIGDFRFSNGGAVPQPIIRDSIRTPNQLVLASGAEKIMFDADSVMMGNTARVGNGQLSVAGNITASGDISSGTVTSGSIVTSQLIIDTLHALSRVAVNHSLMIEKQTAKSYAEVSTTDTAIALVLQKDSAGKGVGIGITPSAGERLSVAGNVGVSGKITSSQGFMFDNQNGFRYTPANGTSPAIFTLGKTNSVILPAAFCSMPIDNVSYAHMPQTQIFSTMQHDNVNSAFLMGSDWSTGNGTLEVEGTDNNGQTNNSLQINNFCGRNTYINTNSALPNRGGTVYLGDQVQMAHSAQIGWNFNPAPNYDINTALNIFPDNNGGNGIKLNTWTNNMPLISINNPSYFTPANSPFVVLNSNGVINATQYLLNGNALGEWITASNGTDIYNSNTGNVGIGTTTPTEKLHIQNGSIYIDGEGQGLIVNEGGHKRVGLMKYPGHEAGIWRASGQDFEIGRLDVSALPGTPTTFTTDIYVAGNGNVGIGTTNNPTEKLEVAGNIKATGIITNGKIQASAYASNSPLIFEAPIGTERARIDDVTGNFGIGTTTPQSKLDILNGSIHLDNSNGNPNDIWTSFGWRTILKAPLGSAWRTTDALNGLYLGYGMGTSGWYWVMSGATDNSGTPFYPMRLEVVGSEPNGMRLSVCGAVYAKKLRIENVVGCDFVFEKDHNKMTWQEKELYYKIYKRLPKMDAAAVMEKDGLDVGTNFSGLLQNVEEDRLDITELFIRIEKIENENKLLKEKIKELEKK